MTDTDPFSRRRALTYITCAAIVALAVPVGAFAATGSLVNITDPVNDAYKARVNAVGQLAVGDGGGKVSVDDGGGTITVDGQVTAAPTGTQTVTGTVRAVQGGVPFRTRCYALASASGHVDAGACPEQ